MTTTRTTITAAAGRLVRRARSGDGGTALLLTIFTMLLVATMSLAVGTAVLVQVRPTQFEQKSTRTLTAAEAGFDVALNRIRAARDANGLGIRSQLPCTDTAGTTFTGTVGTGTDASAYTVTIRYYTVDPSQQSASWRSSTTNLVRCVGGAPQQIPLYALLESRGSGAALPGTSLTGNRTIEQTYRFSTTDEHILGGQITVPTTNLCLAVDSHTNGAAVRVVRCDNQGADILQRWSYTSQLQLQTSDLNGNRYCVQANPSDGAPAVLTSTCDATRANQLWSYNAAGRFEGTTANANGESTGSTNGWCLTIQNDKQAGSIVYLKRECSGDSDTQHTFFPQSSVGAGAAGEATDQLVNYSYYSRCLDITGEDRNATWLIGYPCEQAPSASGVGWSQKFFWDATTQQFCTNTANQTVTACSPPGADLYCLSAGSASSTPTVGGRVLLKPCSPTDTTQKWTRQYDTGENATSYTIRTVNLGLCLEVNPSGASEANAIDKQWGIVLTATCDGSSRQKWNAPPNAEGSRTSNLYEHSP